MNRLAALLVIIAGCKPAPPATSAKPSTSSPGECTAGKTKQTPTTACTCIRSTPHSAVKPEEDVHEHWACTEYSDPTCFGAVQGKACTTDGQKCTVTESDTCMTNFTCTSGAWTSAGPPSCAPASRS